MINYDPEKKIIRETTAPFEYVDDAGKLQTKDIRVQYYSLSTLKLKQMRQAAEKRYKENPDEPQWYSDSLLDRIHAFPDLLDKKGKPHKITLAFLDTIDVRNLDEIRRAIEDDIRPKSQPPTS